MSSRGAESLLCLEHVVVDERIVTGQNGHSAARVAREALSAAALTSPVTPRTRIA